MNVVTILLIAYLGTGLTLVLYSSVEAWKVSDAQFIRVVAWGPVLMLSWIILLLIMIPYHRTQHKASQIIDGE